MAYGIIRAEKVKIVKLCSGLQEHHQRSDKDNYYSNLDINLELTKNNVEFIHSENFRESMYQTIKKYGITRKVRKDAVGLIDGLATVSGDFFKDKTKEEIETYFKNMLPLIEKEFGPIISATLHCDEMSFNQYNYHMHFATVPIVKNGNGNYSLSAKKIMGNQKDYIARQDRFYNQYFKNYGLERGISAKITQKKHIETNRWKAEQVQQLKNDLEEDVEILDNDKQIVELETQIAKRNLKRVNDKIDDFKKQLNELQEEKHIIANDIDSLTESYEIKKEGIKKNIDSLEQTISDRLNYSQYLDDLYENNYAEIDQALQVFNYLKDFETDFLEELLNSFNLDSMQLEELEL